MNADRSALISEDPRLFSSHPDFNTWLAVQRGIAQGPDAIDPVPRYIRDGRDIGQWVHVDVLFQAYFQAFLILAEAGAPFDDGNPTTTVRIRSASALLVVHTSRRSCAK